MEIQLIAGQPLWAKLFYLVRTGHVKEAIAEAEKFQAAIDSREASFVTQFRTWLESPDRKHVLIPALLHPGTNIVTRNLGSRRHIVIICKRSTTRICFIL